MHTAQLEYSQQKRNIPTKLLPFQIEYGDFIAHCQLTFLAHFQMAFVVQERVAFVHFMLPIYH